MNEIRIKQTCFYKIKVSGDIKEDRILESINVHPVELLDNAELYDINTIIMEEEYEN